MQIMKCGTASRSDSHSDMTTTSNYPSNNGVAEYVKADCGDVEYAVARCRGACSVIGDPEWRSGWMSRGSVKFLSERSSQAGCARILLGEQLLVVDGRRNPNATSWRFPETLRDFHRGATTPLESLDYFNSYGMLQTQGSLDIGQAVGVALSFTIGEEMLSDAPMIRSADQLAAISTFEGEAAADSADLDNATSASLKRCALPFATNLHRPGRWPSS